MASKTPQQVAQEFLTQLSSLKPSLDTSLVDSDWYVKAQAIGGVMAGIYGDQELLSNDPFPQSARLDAILKHLQTYFTAPNNQLLPAQSASGYMAVTGEVGTVISTALQAQYLPNGNVYQSLTGLTMATTAIAIPMVSIATGQDQNILDGAPLTVTNPPAGLNSTAYASGDFLLGRDQETPEEAAERILAFIQTPPEGGTAADYVRWAQEASASVTSASTIRFPSGLGTVGIVITAGTTNIDAAIDNGQPVVLSPTQDLIDTVQSYITSKKPLTDCATVIGPTFVELNVNVSAWFTQGDASTILAGQTFTQGELVQNEVKRAIYKTVPGGRQINGVGYIVKSDIEEQIDAGLSSEPFQVGTNPILQDRYVENLAASGPNFTVAPSQVVIPGTINVVAM